MGRQSTPTPRCRIATPEGFPAARRPPGALTLGANFDPPPMVMKRSALFPLPSPSSSSLLVIHPVHLALFSWPCAATIHVFRLTYYGSS